MTIQEIAGLITIRNFIALSVDNLNIRLSREEIKAVQTKVAYLDKLIIEHSLKIDPNKPERERTSITREFNSSEPVDIVASRIRTEPQPETGFIKFGAPTGLCGPTTDTLQTKTKKVQRISDEGK